jgi:hypothetical protein
MVRTTVDVKRTYPSRPKMSREPLVDVRGIVDLNPDPRQKTLPMRFHAIVQIWADGTWKIEEFLPVTGRSDRPTLELVDVYRLAFERTLNSTKLAILGVVP